MAKKENKPTKRVQSSCESCVFYDYDEDYETYICTVDLDEDTMMEIALEAGADDVLTEDDCYTIYTAPADFSAVRKFLEAKGVKFIEADIEMVPNDYITLDDKQVETFLKMIDALEESDDVQSIYHNVNLPEEEDED